MTSARKVWAITGSAVFVLFTLWFLTIWAIFMAGTGCFVQMLCRDHGLL